MHALDEFEFTIKEILFGTNDIFKIELNWCKDMLELTQFVRKVEFELGIAKVKIKEQILILNSDKKEWIIKINRKS
jgi:hypothetical protein